MAKNTQPAPTKAPKKQLIKELSQTLTIRRATGGFVLYLDGQHFNDEQAVRVVSGADVLGDAVQDWVARPIHIAKR